MRTFTDLSFFNRYIIPSLAIICAIFLTLTGSGLYQLIFLQSFNEIKEFLIYLGFAMTSMFIGMLYFRSVSTKEQTK